MGNCAGKPKTKEGKPTQGQTIQVPKIKQFSFWWSTTGWLTKCVKKIKFLAKTKFNV